MGQAPSMATPTALATMTDMRDMSTCDDMISAEECQSVVLNSKWHDWYWADVMYAQTATYFYAAGIALFTLFNLWFWIRHKVKRSLARAISNDPLQLWTSAIAGYLGSRQFRLGRNFGYTLTLGETLIVSSMILFFAAITLGPQPYYWPNATDYGYSPPIATRAGFLAIAILPFQVMFATKWNPITILTGVSHERLQVYHRWSGWIMYVLALIHTFPFIIVDIQTGVMMETWRTDFYTYSGVICLIPQTALVLLSIGVIRDRWYETFKSFHYIMAAWFIVLLFLHCGFTLTSAYYFVGFAVVYTLSLIVRWGRATFNGLHHRASISFIDDQMLHISIPTNLRWKAGQHYFFRFATPSIHALTSHPFTVASMPTSPAVQAEAGGNVMKLFIKKRRGMTQDLYNRAVEGDKVRVFIDGPYGGIWGDMGRYDRVLLIAGGSGGSFILSALHDLVNRQDTITAKSVTIVYACRHYADAAWFREPLFNAAASLRIKIDVDFHISSIDPSLSLEKADSTPTPSKTQTPSMDELEPVPSPSAESPIPSDLKAVSNQTHVLPGRPNLARYIQAATAAAGRGTAGVVVCGPKEMTFDVRNAVAAEQLKIVAGSIGCVECYLHTETFGW